MKIPTLHNKYPSVETIVAIVCYYLSVLQLILKIRFGFRISHLTKNYFHYNIYFSFFQFQHPNIGNIWYVKTIIIKDINI